MTGLPAALVAQASTSYDAVRISAAGVFWIEGRADGRDVLVRWTAEHGTRDITPDGFSVASYVHEYGGGAWTTDGDTVWFCNAADQRVYQMTAHGVIPVTPAPPQPGAVRYADLRFDPHRRLLWAVQERHEPDGVLNDLVSIPLETGAEPRTVASGWDFYSFPRPSPDGRWLAWTCWNAPQMPWDGTCLQVAEIALTVTWVRQSWSREAPTNRCSSPSGAPTVSCTSSVTATAGGACTPGRTAALSRC